MIKKLLRNETNIRKSNKNTEKSVSRVEVIINVLCLQLRYVVMKRNKEIFNHICLCKLGTDFLNREKTFTEVLIYKSAVINVIGHR